METKNVNVSVNEGETFFSNEASINFNPQHFFFDFKSISPRVDLRSKDSAAIAVKHNVVMVDPYHAKQIHNLLSTVIKKYEEEFGEITKPQALENMEKKMAERGEEKKTSTTQTPTYFG